MSGWVTFLLALPAMVELTLLYGLLGGKVARSSGPRNIDRLRRSAAQGGRLAKVRLAEADSLERDLGRGARLDAVAKRLLVPVGVVCGVVYGGLLVWWLLG